MRPIPSRASARRIWPRPRTRSICFSCCARRPRVTDRSRRAESSTNSSTTSSSGTCTLRSSSLDHDDSGLDRDGFHRFRHTPTQEARGRRTQQESQKRLRQRLAAEREPLDVETQIAALPAGRSNFEACPRLEVKPHGTLEPGDRQEVDDGDEGYGRQDVPEWKLALELDQPVADEAHGPVLDGDLGRLGEMPREEPVELGLGQDNLTGSPLAPSEPSSRDLEDPLLTTQAVVGGSRSGNHIRLLEHTGADPDRPRR